MPAKAAFYDVDGTLVKTNVVHVYAYYAMNRGSLLGIAGRTLATAASVPLFAAMDALNRKTFNEFFYRYYAGLSEDRLRHPGRGHVRGRAQAGHLSSRRET